MMKRGDYEVFSAYVAEAPFDDDTRYKIALGLADALVPTGDRFDPILWLEGCDIGPIDVQQVMEWTKRLELRVRSVSLKRLRYRAAEEQKGS